MILPPTTPLSLPTLILLTLTLTLPNHPTTATLTPTCLATYATTLHPHDCVQAMSTLPALTLTPHPGTPPFQTHDFFSRTSPSPRFRLPQRSTVGGCSVFVDVVDPAARLFGPWWGVADGVGAVILECAERGGGVGGRLVQGGLFAAVLASGEGLEAREAGMRVRVDLCIARGEEEVRGEVERCLAEARRGGAGG